MAGKKKIMIFDDDDDIQSICAFILKEDGWEVKAYSDCGDIITRLSEFSPDIILMDNWIPFDGGISATQEIKAIKEIANIHVIYSANSDIHTLAKRAGANSYLPKSFDLDVLKKTVAKVFNNSYEI